MKVRVIFRGLILFRFERSGNEEEKRPMLAAYMLNDSASGGVHFHAPRIALIGRDAETRDEILGQHYPIYGQTITLKFPLSNGVIPDASFNRYVPRLSETFGIARKKEEESARKREGKRDDRLVAAKVVVPSGTIYARSPVTWRDSHQNGLHVPVNVKFLRNPRESVIAGECVLEEDVRNWKKVKIQSSGPIVGMPRELLALTEATNQPHARAAEGTPYRDEVPPDTIDILVTNFAPQRMQPVPWSLHYQWLFRAAGYDELDLTTEPELQQLVDLAETNYPAEWEDDATHFGWEDAAKRRGYPFPYLPTGLREGPVEAAESERKAAEASIQKDPQNRPLCPQGIDDE